jgi:dGTPase
MGCGRRLCPREESEGAEPDYLDERATFSNDARTASRLYPLKPDDFRTAFERDYTRIIHCRAFRRLRHKTQVFIDPRNDHICTRLEHSLHVASVARTISKALHLNNDLVAAISIGHDLGHAPFGHEGERQLKKLAKKHGIAFSHETHSLRVVDRLERMYKHHPGLNLTFAVRDGIACHCGEKPDRTLTPNRRKTPSDLNHAKPGDVPATPEGCVVKFADMFAYLGRDLEDAITTKIIRRSEIPRNVVRTLGRRNRSIIGALIRDLVENSGADRIGVSKGVFSAMLTLKKFNYKQIYANPVVTERFKQIERAMAFMFDELLRLVNEARSAKKGAAMFRGRGERCLEVLAEFLGHDVVVWREEKPAQLVLDFIAGMTDSFFIDSFTELFLPYGTV